MEPKEQLHRPSITERLKHKWAAMFRPASSAAEDSLRDLIKVLPEGDIAKAMEDMIPSLKDLLKTQDRNLVLGSFFSATVGPAVLGIAGTFCGTVLGGLVFNPFAGAIGGGMIGTGVGLGLPSPAEIERQRIFTEAAKQRLTLQTTAGKSAAGAFDRSSADQITNAIIWGAGPMAGGAKILQEAVS